MYNRKVYTTRVLNDVQYNLQGEVKGSTVAVNCFAEALEIFIAVAGG